VIETENSEPPNQASKAAIMRVSAVRQAFDDLVRVVVQCGRTPARSR
jgi:hypothetical protein